jgi:hypothetical protein
MAKSHFILISNVFRIGLAFLLVIAILNKDLQWTLECISGLILSSVPFFLNRSLKIEIPGILDLMITFALFLHTGIGGVLDVYYAFPNFDIATHFISSVLIAFLALITLYILDEYWDGLYMNTYAMAFGVVVITMALGVVWEFGEWTSDTLFGLGAQWGLQDTMTDLLVDTIGGIVLAVVGVILIKKGSLQEMTKDLRKRVDSLINHKK